MPDEIPKDIHTSNFTTASLSYKVVELLKAQS